jgi:hypothetical protein
VVIVGSGEFAESRSVGLAVGCWLQVLLVGFPALYLVDPEDIVASYFLQVGLLFVLCMSMMLIIFGPLVMMVLKYKHNPGSAIIRGGRASTHVSGASQVESNSFYVTASGRDSTHIAGGTQRALQAIGAVRSTTRHPFAGHDEKSLKEMIAIATLKASAGGNGSGASLSLDSFNASKPFSLPDAYHDEEMGKNEFDDSFHRKMVSDIDEGSESADASSIFHCPTQASKTKSPSEKWADSIASITCPEQQVTQQMLLLDLVPKQSMKHFLHESGSSVPFGGGDFLSANYLGDDSDSSVPFQGHLDDNSSSLGDSVVTSSVPRRTADEGSSVSDMPATELLDPALHARLSSKYSLNSSTKDPDMNGSRTRCQPPSPSNYESAPNAEMVQDKSVIHTLLKPMISIVENRKTTKQTEMPFSTRFVGYKERLNYLRSEDGTLSTAESPIRETSEGSIRRMNDSSLTSLEDPGDRTGGKRGSFQHMNEYIVQSIRVADRMGNGSNRLSGSARMMDDSGRVYTGTGIQGNYTQDRSKQSTSSRGTHGGGENSLSQRKMDPEDHARRRIQRDEVSYEDDLIQLEKSGEASSTNRMLGYDLSDEWKYVAGRSPVKKKGGVIKSTLSALHQSMSSFQFSSDDSPVPKETPGSKRKSRFAGLNLSVPALHYTHGSRDDDDEEVGE